MRGNSSWLLIAGTFVLLPGLLLGQPAEAPPTIARGQALFSELGCANCHTDLRLTSPLRERAPDLSGAGQRYRPEYLFDFLLQPATVRRHLGRARMPGFHLTEREALALVAFLETQREAPGEWPPMPSAITNRAEMRTVSREQFQKELAGGLICLTCHQLEGQGGEVGIELASVGYRLRPEWVREYLVAPARFGVAPAAMPPQFYQLADDGKSFRETTTRAAERLGVIADYLCSLNAARREALGKKYANAKAAWPHADAVLGETLFRSLNCAACHRHHAIAPRPQPAAPDLSGEGLRVNRAWLDAYLKQPRAIRPFGHQPGDGSRMPDFRLSDDEATELSAFLSAQKPKAQAWPDVFRPQPMTAFAQQKAKLLLTEKLSCLGCHTFGGPGGRIGPDLAAARQRLQPDYLYGIITNPRATTPHAMMPRVPMPEDTARLLANYLWQQTNAPAPAKHLSAADHPVIPTDESAPNSGANAQAVRRAYVTFCAPCHGASGQGDGFNARYLPVKPTAHADARHLSTRPDDTLYDGIHAGGYILNKSHLMPPWGATFSPKQIRELVAHLRTLCQCQGPAWSRDDARALNK